MIKGIYSLFVEEASDWDSVGDNDIQLYKAKLKIDIGPFKAGTVVDTFYLGLLDEPEMCVCIYIGDTEYKASLNFIPQIGEMEEREYTGN